MKPSEELPEEIRSRFARELESGGKEIAAASTDITSDGRYGREWMVVTERKIFVISPDHLERPTIRESVAKYAKSRML